MGKHAKTPSTTSQAGPPPPDATLDASSPLAPIEDGLRIAFDACLEMVKQGDAPVQVLRELGGLGRAITTVQSERRAQAKTREYTAKNLPPELVMEHLRLISADRRAHIRREMDAMDDSTSVLG